MNGIFIRYKNLKNLLSVHYSLKIFYIFLKVFNISGFQGEYTYTQIYGQIVKKIRPVSKLSMKDNILFGWSFNSIDI